METTVENGKIANYRINCQDRLSARIKILSKLVEGNPQVDIYEISNSTFHKVGAAATA